MSEWQPIESAPKDGDFLAWHSGDISRVRRFDMGPRSVVNGMRGRWWNENWWMPLPPDPPTALRPTSEEGTS